MFRSRDIGFPKTVNCQACGSEYVETDLKTVKLAGFTSPIEICKSCSDKSVEDSFKDAAEILNDIVNIAKSDKDPERRLLLIKALIGE
jgi:hypothetical protein